MPRPPARTAARPRRQQAERSVAAQQPVPAPAAEAASPRDALAAHVERLGLRWTRQRELLLDTFLSSHEHLTCDEIHGRVASIDPSLGLATTYRTLRLFVEAGIASERRFHDGVTRYETRHHHHDHLICTQCGRIVEFESDAIESLQEDVARAHGFRLASHRHELYGRCADCSRD